MSGSVLFMLRKGKMVFGGGGNPAAKAGSALPFERTVCRLYMDCMRPQAYWPAKNEPLPRVPFDGRPIEEYVDMIADIGTEAWFAGSYWNGVWYPSKMVPQNKNIPSEQLACLLKRGRERGIFIGALQQLTEPECHDLVPEFKDWALYPIDDGRGLKPDGTCMSIFSPYRSWVKRFMAEMIRVGGYEGFWFDGSAFAQRHPWPWAAGDVGPYGREAYKRETGRDVPEKVDFRSQPFREWVNWRYVKMIDFFNDVTEATCKVMPDQATVINYYARPLLAWEVAHPLRRLDVKWYPSFESESSTLCKVGWALTPRTEIWFWAQKYIPELANGESAYVSPDAAIARGLRVVAHGLAPDYGGLEVDILLWKDAMKATFTELKKRRPYMGGETVKYAALLISQQTRDFGFDTDAIRAELKLIAAREGNRKPHDRETDALWRSWEGVVEIHNAGHLMVDVIFDDSFTSKELAQYPVVFIGNAACLSEGQCETLRRYVQGGGTLIATQQASLFDEWGNKRDNFALADMFGVDYVGVEEDAQMIMIPHKEELKEKLGYYLVSFVAPAVARVRAKPGTTAEVLYTKSARGCVGGIAVKVNEFDTGSPAVTRQKLGRGTVYYLTADVGLGYVSHWQRQVADLICYLESTAAPPPFEIHAPKLLEARAFWQGKKRMVVHLVNCSPLFNLDMRPYTSTGSPNATMEMTPLADIAMTIKNGQVKRALMPFSGTTLAVTNGKINIPVVRYGEVVVVEFA